MNSTFVPTATFSLNMFTELKGVVEKLLKANNTVTTLEVKNQLRKDFPFTQWNQSDVSQAMDHLSHIGELNYTDNGTFRVYSGVPKVNVVSTNTPQGQVLPNVTIVKVKPSLTKKSIGKNEALKVMLDTNGKFFGATFIKKDGTERKMTCRIESTTTAPDNLGYLQVIDVNEGVPKKLNMQTVLEIRSNNTVYKVK